MPIHSLDLLLPSSPRTTAVPSPSDRKIALPFARSRGRRLVACSFPPRSFVSCRAFFLVPTINSLSLPPNSLILPNFFPLHHRRGKYIVFTPFSSISPSSPSTTPRQYHHSILRAPRSRHIRRDSRRRAASAGRRRYWQIRVVGSDLKLFTPPSRFGLRVTLPAQQPSPPPPDHHHHDLIIITTTTTFTTP
jgi:hypothetical protein